MKERMFHKTRNRSMPNEEKAHGKQQIEMITTQKSEKLVSLRHDTDLWPKTNSRPAAYQGKEL